MKATALFSVALALLASASECHAVLVTLDASSTVTSSIGPFAPGNQTDSTSLAGFPAIGSTSVSNGGTAAANTSFNLGNDPLEALFFFETTEFIEGTNFASNSIELVFTLGETVSYVVSGGSSGTGTPGTFFQTITRLSNGPTPDGSVLQDEGSTVGAAYNHTIGNFSGILVPGTYSFSLLTVLSETNLDPSSSTILNLRLTSLAGTTVPDHASTATLLLFACAPLMWFARRQARFA